MGKVAFVFAGQGAQYVGMGRDLYTSDARPLFDLAEKIRPGTLKTMFEGDPAALNDTINAQPCLYLMDFVSARAALSAGAKPDMLAGFSLGEVAAAAFSGLLSFESGFRLVMRRAEMMRDCALRNPGRMYAVLRLTEDAVKNLCAGFSKAFPVNFNCPGQIVAAVGLDEAEAFEAAVKAAGGRALALKVSGAFHSPFMDEAAKGLKEALCSVSLGEIAIPLYANKTAARYDAASAKELLSGQINSPVRWEEGVRAMIRDGADTFVEVGAGHTLSGLIAKIDPNVRAFAAGDEKSLCALKEAL